MIRVRRSFASLAVLAAALSIPAASGAQTTDAPSADTPQGALLRLAQAQPDLRYHHAGFLGTIDSVRAPAGSVLVRDDAARTPEARAFSFLREHGALVGMTTAERARPRASFAVRSSRLDPVTGITHVRLDQRSRGLEVFGAQVVVHLSARGVTGVSGTFAPGTAGISTEPRISEARAIERAIATADVPEGTELTVRETALQIYREGLITQQPGRNRLAWMVDLEGENAEEQVWVDASSRRILNRIERLHGAKDRCAYTPHYDPSDPSLFLVREEGDPDTLIPPVDNLFRFSGQVYDLFDNAFGYDSWDGAGAKMRTVYETGTIATIEALPTATIQCPNAYWSSAQKVTRYCPGFDLDDVVAHEWGHAYTDSTHDLIYQVQPGALNEAYSDIWGEVLDLLNGEDGIGGSNNAQPYPDGQRWIVGEDLTDEVAGALALRDLWDPNRRDQPAKVSDANYTCSLDLDNGGVHYNSSIPGHAFAMLTDGKTFNGHTVGAIGMDKAAHVYWQAAANYQTPTSGFPQHAEALAAGCADLIGIDPNGLLTGSPIASPFTSADCDQVDEAMLATEMADAPVACGGPLLKAGAPGPCLGSTTLLDEDFEGGLGTWTTESIGANPPTWPGYNWAATGGLPDARPGSAAFAANSGDPSACGNTTPANHAGRFSITSATMAVPVDSATVQVRFDHYVASEPRDDGGNVLVSVDGGPFQLVPASAYLHNAPNSVLRTTTNPKNGQSAFNGGDANVLTGTWGTSVLDLNAFVDEGDTFQLRFEFGQDCVIGATGWYVDDVLITACPVQDPPTLALGADYANPDPDGAYTLDITAPSSAIGPHDIQEAVLGPPVFADDAENGLSNWVTTTSGGAVYAVGGTPPFGWSTSTAKPNASTTFHAFANEVSDNHAAMMTTATPLSIPATGQANLHFDSWHSNDAPDDAIVEISDDGGANWDIVFRDNSPTTLTGGAVATPVTQYQEFLTESLEHEVVDLSAYAGQSVHMRFRFQQNGTIYVNIARLGWYVDNISIEHIDWQDIATTGAGSYLVTGRTTGKYLYRARTTYPFGQSDWGPSISATVS